MKIRDLVLPEHFCPQPFTYIYAEHLGSWKPCCKTDRYPDKHISFDEWWYEDEDLNELRNALLNDEVTPIINEHCAPCRSPEFLGIKSHRQYILDSLKDDNVSKALTDLIATYKRTETVMLKPNQRLFSLKVRGFGNSCNLKCYMCFPGNSSSRINEMSNASEESVDIFYRTGNSHEKLKEARQIMLDIDAEKSRIYEAIESVSSNISHLNLAGGEPIIIEEYYNLMDKFIKSSDAKDITIFMNSNLTKLGVKDKSILDYIDKFKNFNIQASIDDIFERDNWARYPSKFETILKNYNILSSYDNIQIKVNVTWSLLNISNAENILNFFEERNIEVNKNLNFVNSPKELSVKNYPFKNELIERYSKSNNSILNDLAKALSDEFVQEEFDAAIRYIKDLDRLRKTKSYEVYPELKQFLID